MEILKRIARWLLSDERASAANAFAALQASYYKQCQATTEYSNELGRLRSRVQRVASWAVEHRPNNLDLRAVTQFVAEGPEGPRANCHGVHPFDRWGVFPKP